MVGAVDYVLLALLVSTAFWPFLHCLDAYSKDQNPDVGKKCAMGPEANMNWDEINECRTGSLGHK